MVQVVHPKVKPKKCPFTHEACMIERCIMWDGEDCGFKIIYAIYEKLNEIQRHLVLKR